MEDDFPFQFGDFQVRNVSFWGCVPRIVEDNFLYNFAPYFLLFVFASEDLEQKEGEI